MEDQIVDSWEADGERTGDVLFVQSPISDQLLRGRNARQVGTLMRRVCQVRSVGFYMKTEEDEKRKLQRLIVSVGGFDKGMVSMEDASSAVFVRLMALLA